MSLLNYQKYTLQVNYFKVIIFCLFGVAASAQNEGIRPWEMRNANGKGYVMVSGVDSVMYYDVLDNYIRDTLGYSRIDSIKCVSDTIRIYTNNGQFKMPFSCSGGGGGSGDITAVNVTPYLTGGGTSGDVTVGIDTTGTIGVATKYDISGMGDVTGITATSPLTGGGTSGNVTVGIQVGNGSQNGYISSTDWNTFNNKIGGSGTANYVPFFSGTSTLTAQHDFLTLNSTNAFKLGIGFRTGGNSQLSNYFSNSIASGLAISDKGSNGLAALSIATNASNIYTMQTDSTSKAFSLQKYSGSVWTEYLNISQAGDYKLNFLALNATQPKVVTVDQNGILDYLTNGGNGTYLGISGGVLTWGTPTGTATNLSWSNIVSTSARLNSSTGNFVTLNAGTGVTFATSGTPAQLTINAASSGTTGLTNYLALNNASNSALAVYTGTTTTPANINFSSVTGGNMSYNGSGINIPSTGPYEIIYTLHVSTPNTAANIPYLWSGIYVNPGSGSVYTLINGTESYQDPNSFVINGKVKHTNTSIVNLTNGSFIRLYTKLNNATASYTVETTGASLSIKKLN